MAYTWTKKPVYIRETTDGKTRWVKLEGVLARRSGDRVEITLRNFEVGRRIEDGIRNWSLDEDEQVFISRRE